MDRRLAALERAGEGLNKDQQALLIKMKEIEGDMERAKADIALLRSGVARVFSIFGGGIIAAFAAWVVSGGLSNVGK